jgi:hypothetical protein
MRLLRWLGLIDPAMGGFIRPIGVSYYTTVFRQEGRESHVLIHEAARPILGCVHHV